MQMTKLATRTPYCNRYFILYRVQRPLSADLNQTQQGARALPGRKSPTVVPLMW